MGAITRQAAMLLRLYIMQRRCWASNQQTAAWLKTETGQRIAALINERRKEDAKNASY